MRFVGVLTMRWLGGGFGGCFVVEFCGVEMEGCVDVVGSCTRIVLRRVEENGGMKSAVTAEEVARFLEAWFAVRQYIQASNFNRFQGAGLSATQFMTLNLLPADGEGVAMGELARRMNLKPATVAKTVDSLEARGMVARAPKEADKRVVLVRVTEAGAELQNAANGQFQDQIKAVFEAMGREERDGLIAGLESMLRAAGERRAGA